MGRLQIETTSKVEKIIKRETKRKRLKAEYVNGAILFADKHGYSLFQQDNINTKSGE